MLRELCESGKLTAVGKGKISKYVLKRNVRKLIRYIKYLGKPRVIFLCFLSLFKKGKKEKERKKTERDAVMHETYYSP